jgi:hypothetical protein
LSLGSQQLPASEYRQRKVEGLGSASSLEDGSVSRKDNSVKRSFKDEAAATAAAGGTKSILDFLGIFDTRRFFYIPSERRTGVEAGDQQGILDSISRWWEGGDTRSA